MPVSYTHLDVYKRQTLHALHAAYVAGEPQHLGVADHAWVTLDEVERYAFAVTDRKIIAALRLLSQANSGVKAE